MTLEDYLILLESPETVDTSHIADLNALLQYAPYCSSAHILLLKALYKTHDTNFSARLSLTLLHAHNSREVYFLLHPRAVVRQVHTTGNDWFSLVTRFESMSRKTGESFEQLALKLKQARLGLVQEETGKCIAQSSTQPKQDKPQPLPTEEYASQLIRQKNYTAALEILRTLNLHNPKKSRYFADQIAYLEKVLSLQNNN